MVSHVQVEEHHCIWTLKRSSGVRPFRLQWRGAGRRCRGPHVSGPLVCSLRLLGPPHCSLPWLRPLAHLWVANALGNAATHLAGGRPSTTPWTPTEGSLPLAVESFALCLDVCKATPCGHDGGLRWHPCNRTLMRTWQAVFTGMCPFLGSTRTTVLAALSAGLASPVGMAYTQPAARLPGPQPVHLAAPLPVTPCHHSTQSCWAAPARFDMCLPQPATCGGKC